MDNSHLLSIIIPVYNGAHYIHSLINSIQLHNQDFIDQIEIILVNDGSTDDSDSVCNSLKEKNLGVSYYIKDNGGIASARNYGMSKAKGKYITFCDQDDTLIKSYLPFLDYLQKCNGDVLVSNFYVSQGDELHKKDVIKKDCQYERSDIEKILAFFIGEGELMNNNEIDAMKLTILPNTIWNGIYKKDLIDINNIQFHKFVDFEDDWLFIISVLFAAKRLCVSEDAYYCWTINPNSESHTRKYISDFYQKRKALYQWVDQKVERLAIDPLRVANYKRKVLVQNVVWGFYNACRLDVRSYLKEIVQGEELIDKIGNYQSPVGRLGILYYFLLKKRYYRIAYYLNKYTFNRSYH